MAERARRLRRRLRHAGVRARPLVEHARPHPSAGREWDPHHRKSQLGGTGARTDRRIPVRGGAAEDPRRHGLAHSPPGYGCPVVAANFWTVLRDNPNYRYTWMGQVVSEIGDHFNSIAVLSLAVQLTGSGVAVGGVMIARTLFAIAAGPIAGVVLDRFDRKRIMIASDLIRAVIAFGFVLILTHQQTWLLYVLSGLLMFASPFFTSGRSAILPRITSAEELHTANALTQTTAWLTLSFGTLFGGISTMQFGYEWAFVVNALSFVFSAWAIWRLRSPQGHFRPDRAAVAQRPHGARAYWGDFVESLRYMRSTPLILALALAWG